MLAACAPLATCSAPTWRHSWLERPNSSTESSLVTPSASVPPNNNQHQLNLETRTGRHAPVTITLCPPLLSGTVTALSSLLAEGRGAAFFQAELPSVSREVEVRVEVQSG